MNNVSHIHSLFQIVYEHVSSYKHFYEIAYRFTSSWTWTDVHRHTSFANWPQYICRSGEKWLFIFRRSVMSVHAYISITLSLSLNLCVCVFVCLYIFSWCLFSADETNKAKVSFALCSFTVRHTYKKKYPPRRSLVKMFGPKLPNPIV